LVAKEWASYIYRNRRSRKVLGLLGIPHFRLMERIPSAMALESVQDLLFGLAVTKISRF
jgi:hypothetical protein